jgi:hypothetical protein
MNLIIITSVINISRNPLDYTKTRSVFSTQERYIQTILTIKSLNKMTNRKILFIEGSEIDKEYENTIRSNVDFFIQTKNDHRLKPIIDGLSKGSAEAALTIEALKCINIEEYDNVFKISGRYHLNDSYRESIFEEKLSIFKLSGGSYCTTLYKINKKDYDLYIKTLDKAFESGKMYEIVFFDAFFKIAKEIDNLGVSGEVSVDGNHIVQ